MAEIRVHFPQTGDPIVMPETEAVVTGRMFTWVIRNENPKINVVGIEFDNGEQYFNGQSVYEKPLVQKEATIWGTAPAIGRPNVTVPAKYTVYGKTAVNGSIVEQRDPKILPTDP
jgi:hypothetical protein